MISLTWVHEKEVWNSDALDDDTVSSSQAYPPATVQHDTVAMNYEKQYGIPKGRPLSNVGTQSPKLIGKSSSLPKVAGSQAVHGLPALHADSKTEKFAAQDGYRDDSGATPVKAFLNSNITPRSGSRKARAETASPKINASPNKTPTTSRPASLHERSQTPLEDPRALGLRISNAGRRSRTGSMVSDGPGSSVSSRPLLMERNDSFTKVTSPESPPKFFHVDDVKPTAPPRPVPNRSLPQSRLPGNAPAKDVMSNGRLSTMSNDPARDESRGTSSYANDPNEFGSASSRLASGISSNRPPLQTIYSEHTVNSPPRASSPLKEEILPRKSSINKASPRRHTRLVSNGGSELKSPEPVVLSNGELSRRSSLNAAKNPRYTSHARSSSVHSTGASQSRRSSIALSDTSPIERARTTSLVGANGALPHSVNPPSVTKELPDHRLPSQVQSPTKQAASGQSKIDQMNELAANARKERKVLDLEISNSSLLAINRTLERQMRKQNAELKRYRRLSRCGRISIAPSSGSASGKLSILSETATNIDPDDLVSSTDEDDDPADLNSTLSSTSAASSPSPIAQATRARFQDPTLVELDLNAHRALLLESQKLNLSIKRCLGYSESLISSGRRALEYQAHAPQPANLEPRVLTSDEFDGGILSRGQGLLSPSHDHMTANPWERSLGSIESLDSGIETPDYSKWGPPTAAQTPFTDTAAPMDLLSSDGAPLEEPSEAAQDLEAEMNDGLSTSPGDEGRRTSMVASIDGLDDDSDAVSKSYFHEVKPVPAPQGTNPDCYVARAERKDDMKPPKPQPGQPGYRGSMQNLGHYLQAFSIFGTSQQT